MSILIEEILKHNREFVAKGDYARYDTPKFPAKKLAIVSCMDTRLVELLPAAMGLKNGDIKLIKNASGTINQPFDSTIRSLLIAVYLLKVEEIAVVGHYDCGVEKMEPAKIIGEMLKRGVKQDQIDLLNYCGCDLESWLKGFEDSAEAVRATMSLILRHPLMPESIPVHGFLMDPESGRLDRVTPE